MPTVLYCIVVRLSYPRQITLGCPKTCQLEDSEAGHVKLELQAVQITFKVTGLQGARQMTAGLRLHCIWSVTASASGWSVWTNGMIKSADEHVTVSELVATWQVYSTMCSVRVYISTVVLLRPEYFSASGVHLVSLPCVQLVQLRAEDPKRDGHFQDPFLAKFFAIHKGIG